MRRRWFVPDHLVLLLCVFAVLLGALSSRVPVSDRRLIGAWLPEMCPPTGPTSTPPKEANHHGCIGTDGSTATSATDEVVASRLPRLPGL